MSKDYHEEMLNFMAELRKKGVLQIRRQDAKHIISEHFGKDRHTLKFIMEHLLLIKFFKKINGSTYELDYDAEEKYREDKLFYLVGCV